MGTDQQSSAGQEAVNAQREARTQFDAAKSADQTVVWAIDPSRPLSRQRQLWYSNGSLFDLTNFTQQAGGETLISLTATGSDSARLESAFVGQYIAHALSEPGMGLSIAEGNINVAADGSISLDHGLLQMGPMFHDGSQIVDGWALEIDTNGARIPFRANGSDVLPPVPQKDWNVNNLLGGVEPLDISDQTVINFPYGFYNALPLGMSRVHTRDREEERRTGQQPLHEQKPQSDPLLHHPSLPMSIYVSNEGTASTLEVGVGGMQYARFGEDEPQFRVTAEFRSTTGGTFTSSTTSNTPTPFTTSGDPIVAYQRQDDEKDLTVRDREIIIDPTADLFLYFWDEWDASTALDGTFSAASGAEHPGETGLDTSTDSTTYTRTVSNLRGVRRVVAGQKNEVDPTSQDIEDRLPRKATRVVTGVDRTGGPTGTSTIWSTRPRNPTDVSLTPLRS